MEPKMADETRTPQKEPAEGSRKVIEHELERQSANTQPGGAGGGGSDKAGKEGTDKAGTESRH